MDIQTRKIKLIQEVLRMKNENIMEKLENILHQEKKKQVHDKEFNSMTLGEFNSLIDSAESDDAKDKLHNASEILKDIDRWK